MYVLRRLSVFPYVLRVGLYVVCVCVVHVANSLARYGPLGRATLCNRCGIRWAKKREHGSAPLDEEPGGGGAGGGAGGGGDGGGDESGGGSKWVDETDFHAEVS